MRPLEEDLNRSRDVKKILEKGNLLKPFEIGLAVVDLQQKDVNGQYRVFGYDMDEFIYPASVSKIYIAAEVWRQAANRGLDLSQTIEIKVPNDIDRDPATFPADTRDLLKPGDSVSIDYLLDLMLSRSDNTASNVLIDLIGRDAINRNIISRNGWQGSEVTRKFLPRSLEEPMYKGARITMSCPRHVVDCFVRMTDTPFTALRLQKYMRPNNDMWPPKYYCRKGGKHSSQLSTPRKMAHWLHETGIVLGRYSTYAIALMTLDKNELQTSSFPLETFMTDFNSYMESYKY